MRFGGFRSTGATGFKPTLCLAFFNSILSRKDNFSRRDMQGESKANAGARSCRLDLLCVTVSWFRLSNAAILGSGAVALCSELVASLQLVRDSVCGDLLNEVASQSMVLKFKSEISDEILGEDTRGSGLLPITGETHGLQGVWESSLLNKDAVEPIKSVSLGSKVSGDLDNSEQESKPRESPRLMVGKGSWSTLKTDACEGGDFSAAGTRLISDKREATSSTLGCTLEVGLFFLPRKQNVEKKNLNRVFHE